jgi:hypothetical protein
MTFSTSLNEALNVICKSGDIGQVLSDLQAVNPLKPLTNSKGSLTLRRTQAAHAPQKHTEQE